MIERVPKLAGADSELGNYLVGVERAGGTGHEASRAILREVVGVPGARPVHAASCRCVDCLAGRSITRFDERDWGRKFSAANGGCTYIDLDHIELCLPEVLSAFDWVAAWHASLRNVRAAVEQANDRQREGREVRVLVNNSDGFGNAYGSHLDFLVTRRAWDNLFERKMQHLLWLAAYQVSSIVFTGQGKVGVENGHAAVPYQISQRADFFECIAAHQTTFARPIVNSRDEALCGWSRRREDDEAEHPRDRLARLHVIFYDNNLCHVANLLKVGVMQIVLSMIEAEEIDTRLILDDPVEAVVTWSHDPDLEATAPTCDGRALTAVELQLEFLERAKSFVDRGGCDGIVPRAGEIVALWEDTVVKLRERDFAGLSGRLDWVLKRAAIERALDLRPDLDRESPAVKQLDLAYSDLDPRRGLYWRYEPTVVERVVTDEEIELLRRTPPEDTRAWGRAMLLRLGGDLVEDVNWDFIKFRTEYGYWSGVRRLDLADPLGFTRAALAPVLDRSESLEDVLEAMERQPEPPRHGETNGRRHHADHAAA